MISYIFNVAFIFATFLINPVFKLLISYYYVMLLDYIII